MVHQPHLLAAPISSRAGNLSLAQLWIKEPRAVPIMRISSCQFYLQLRTQILTALKFWCA